MAKRYHSNNGIFISDYFRSDFQGKKQTQYFSTVGVKHQNGTYEGAVHTISYWDCNMITHAALYCTSDNVDSIRLW